MISISLASGAHSESLEELHQKTKRDPLENLKISKGRGDLFRFLPWRFRQLLAAFCYEMSCSAFEEPL